MLLTYGGKTINILKWWHDHNEFSYQIISQKTGKPIGGIVTRPTYFLRDNLEYYRSGAFIRVVKDDGELIWQRTKYRY